jgi:hypothetical protein
MAARNCATSSRFCAACASLNDPIASASFLPLPTCAEIAAGSPVRACPRATARPSEPFALLTRCSAQGDPATLLW